MSDIFEILLEHSQRGYSCSQSMLLIALESEGKENPDLIRAVGGLRGGLDDSGEVCGALSGGMCFLSYFGGRGADDEVEDPNLSIMTKELYEWFVEYTAEYGGIDCRQILDDDERNQIQRCPMVVRDTVEKCISLLQRFDLI
ncbi:MAG: C_GCAxxG_C_C family protein [Tissierellia bacterium]|nr:C-GCAxxG-C-C family protein [Bacillota bacterium]NLL22421.1 C_GCAxxG_C_C family protein [Tissierellia bacterium]